MPINQRLRSIVLSNKSRQVCAGIASAGLLAASVFFQACGGSATPSPTKGAGKKGGDAPVTVAKAVTKDVPVDISVIGNVEAYSTITVKAQVGGELTKVHFEE